MRANKAKRHDELLKREIDKATSKFSQHLMSNSKWVRLIDKLVENTDKILKIVFKKVQKDQLGELYLDEDTTFEFDYWQTGFEGHNSLGGFLGFNEIEFLIFPKFVDNKEQDIIYIAELIKSIGQYPLDINENRLRLSCYKV